MSRNSSSQSSASRASDAGPGPGGFVGHASLGTVRRRHSDHNRHSDRGVSLPRSSRAGGHANLLVQLEARLYMHGLVYQPAQDAATTLPTLGCGCGCCGADGSRPGVLSVPLDSNSDPTQSNPDSSSAYSLPIADSGSGNSGSSSNGSSAGGQNVAFSTSGTNTLTVPAHSSRPSAAKKIFLDFNGTAAMDWGTYEVPATPAFDIDNNTSSFSSVESNAISSIWARVAEKFSIFDLDVTTVDPGSYPGGQIIRVVVGGDGAWLGSSAGGVSYINGFTLPASYGPEFNFNTAFAFTKNLGNGNVKFTAEAIAHEAGHSLGLQHQATWNGTTLAQEYNPGNTLTAPILGNSYGATRGLWWVGPTSQSSTSIQDDIAVITRPLNGITLRSDDYGDSISQAFNMVSNAGNISASGVITTLTDTDYFSFTTRNGPISLTLSPAANGAMLDASMTLFNSAGTVVANLATSTLGEFLYVTLQAGTYHVRVASAGNTGDLGQYTLTGTVIEAEVPPVAASNLSGSTTTSGVILIWQDNSLDETAFNIERSINGGSTWQVIGTVSSNTTAFIDSTAAFGTPGSYRVIALNTIGSAAPSNVATITRLPGAATALSATVNSSSSVTVTWTGVTGATSYRIERSLNTTTWQSLGSVSATATLQYTDTTASGSTKYHYRIVSVVGTTDGQSSQLATVTTVPSAPLNATGQALSTTSARVSWSANGSVSGYRIQQLTGGSWSTFATVSASTTTYTFSNLTPGQALTLRIRGYNSTGDGDVSATISTGALAPVPSGLAASTGAPGQINLSWTDVSGESAYQIEYAPFGSTDYLPGPLVPANTTTATLTNLSSATTYVIRIRSISQGGTSAPSATATATTTPPTPTGLTITSSSTSSIRAEWQNITGETGYRLERLVGSSWVSTTNTTADSTSATISGLTPGSVITLRVIALGQGGESAPSEPATGSSLLAAPTNVSATALTHSTVRVSWSDSVNETGYTLQYSLSGQNNWITAAQLPQDVITYVVEGLDSATTYQFRLISSNSFQSSAPSAAATATTKLGPPQGVAILPIDTTALEVTWLASKGASSYSVERSLDGISFQQAVTVSASSTLKFRDTAIDAFTTYYYRVIAFGSLGQSPPSDVVFASADEALPVAAPTSASVVLTTSSQGKYQAKLTWEDASTNETKFVIERSSDGGNTWSVIAQTNKNITTYTDEPTIAATLTYRVKAAGRFVESAPVLAGTVVTLPEAPAGVTATLVGSVVQIRWQDIATHETGYTVRRSANGGSSWTTLANLSASATAYDDTTAQVGNSYLYEVFARGPIANSTPVQAPALNILPSAVTGLSVISRTASSVRLSWSTTTGTAQYTVMVSSDGGATFSPVQSVPGSNLTVSSLSDATQYIFHVVAVSSAGLESAPSDSISVVTLPVSVDDLNATVAGSAIELRWTNNNASYVLQRAIGGQNYQDIALIPTGTNFYSDASAEPGTSYTYRILSIGPDGSQATGSVASARINNVNNPPPDPNPEPEPEPEPEPNAPIVTATPSGKDRITLSWNDTTDAESAFVVQQSTDGGATWNSLRLLKPNTTSLANIRLRAGTASDFRVMAVSGNDVLKTSQATRVVTPPAAVRRVTARFVSGQLVLSIQPSPGADSYTIERSSDGVNFQSVGQTTSTTFVQDNLPPGSTLRYRVIASVSGSASPASRPVVITTPPPATTVTGASIDSRGQFVLSWQDVSGETGYILEASPDGSSWRAVAKARANATSAPIKSHADGQTLQYRVIAISKSGSSPASDPRTFQRFSSTADDGSSTFAVRPISNGSPDNLNPAAFTTAAFAPSAALPFSNSPISDLLIAA